MKIIITSHGKLCDGIVDSYKMIVGASRDIVTLSFNGSLKEFRKEQNKIFNDFREEQIIVLCDLIGGTPYNEFYRAKIENLFKGEIICGFNLGMVIELSLALNDNVDLSSAIEIALNTGKSSVMLVDFENSDDNDEIEF